MASATSLMLPSLSDFTSAELVANRMPLVSSFPVVSNLERLSELPSANLKFDT
ncbi:hypothetical protein D3C72_2550330 [compost metagenome]